VARSGQSGTERPKTISVDKAEQEDAHASDCKRQYEHSGADVEGQRAY
jgi:hypothetical protein